MFAELKLLLDIDLGVVTNCLCRIGRSTLISVCLREERQNDCLTVGPGEEWVDGGALRLDPGVALFVQFADPRCKFTGVWLPPDDVVWEGKAD